MNWKTQAKEICGTINFFLDGVPVTGSVFTGIPVNLGGADWRRGSVGSFAAARSVGCLCCGST